MVGWHPYRNNSNRLNSNSNHSVHKPGISVQVLTAHLQLNNNHSSNSHRLPPARLPPSLGLHDASTFYPPKSSRPPASLPQHHLLLIHSLATDMRCQPRQPLMVTSFSSVVSCVRCLGTICTPTMPAIQQ